ncbi:MAG: type II secretion system F family protein [Armatimonadota bacterium]|nr:type II secretion system F family protein [Armatimonadota bacterium]
MPSFEYVSRDARGALVRGQVEALTDAEARAWLRQQGLFVTALTERRPPRRGTTRTVADVALLAYHLATLVGAGLPLLQGFQALAEQLDDPRLRALVEALAADIQEGRQLSAAMARRPDVFSPVVVGIVRSGEVGGRLDEALARLAAYLERELEFRRRVRDALLYPGFVLVLALAVLGVFLAVIIPAFDRVYRSAGAELPALTQALVMASRLVRANLLVLVAGVPVVLLPPVRRRFWEAVAAPLLALGQRVGPIRGLAHTLQLARFTQALGALLQSGVPVLTAIEVAREAGASPAFARVTEALQASISEGRRLSEGMRATGTFPPLVVRMVALGEESGRLDAMVVRVGEVLDREFERAVRRLLAFLEPVLTLALGALVGFILLALYLPIFGLGRSLTR